MTRIEPIYQYQNADGRWIDQNKTSYEYNVRYGEAIARIVYTAAQMRQAMEACAAKCAEWENSTGDLCASSVRNLIKEMLP